MNYGSAGEVRDSIRNLVNRRRNYNREITELTTSYPYVVFYGCGIILRGIIDKWNTHIGRKIDFCCDSDPKKWGKVFHGATCISPDELILIKDQCAVFVTIGDFGPIFDFLEKMKFPSVNHIFKYDLMVSESLQGEDPEQVTDNLCATYDLLADRQSKLVFWAIVERVLGDTSNINIMVDVCENNQYFPQDIILLSESESLVDIGAYDGDTIREFLKRTNGKFDRIFSFELDAINFRKLEANIQDIPGRERIKLYNVGIWDRECDVDYSTGLSNSTIGQGDAKGHVMPLDEVLKEEKVSFIKMDIEGAEPEALRGAINLLKTQKPKLAICVYHDFRHLWEIPLYIASIVPEYKFYLRHHNYLEYETVCYALP